MNRYCILVTGSRKWTDGQSVFRRLSHWYQELCAIERSAWERSVLLHGAAPGADRIADSKGTRLGLLTESTPYFSEQGKRGGPLRNALLHDKLMLYCQHGYKGIVEAFWRPDCIGTKDMLSRVYRGPAGLAGGSLVVPPVEIWVTVQGMSGDGYALAIQPAQKLTRELAIQMGIA